MPSQRTAAPALAPLPVFPRKSGRRSSADRGERERAPATIVNRFASPESAVPKSYERSTSTSAFGVAAIAGRNVLE